jgi:hypothetical protein
MTPSTVSVMNVKSREAEPSPKTGIGFPAVMSLVNL